MQMLTDPARKRKTDPGNPDICPVFDLQKIFGPKEWIEHVDRECRSAEIGCVDDKKALAESLNERQTRVLRRMLEDDFEGFMTSSKWARMTGTSQDTAGRDIRDWVERGILVQNPAGGRSTSYRLAL